MTALFCFFAVLFQVVAAGPCRDGWIYYDVTKLCYSLSKIHTSYFKATELCKAEGGVLASPHTKQELKFVASISEPYTWVGLDDLQTKGIWRWQDGQTLQYNAWHPRSPTGIIGNNCVQFLIDNNNEPILYDDACEQLSSKYVCQQVPPTPDPCDGFTCENSGVCNSETGVAVCDCPTGYTGERCEKNKTVSYEVIVFTSNVTLAGTDANVYIRIIGESGTSFEKLLANDNVEEFEQGQTDTFAFDAVDVGKINTVVIWHDNSGSYAGWHLGYVTVRKYETSGYVDYTFNCDCWLDKDGTLSRTLENPKVSSSA